MLKGQKKKGNSPHNKVGRSRSRSLSPGRSKPKLNNRPGKHQKLPKTSRGHGRDRANPSLGKSQSKRSLQRSQSGKGNKQQGRQRNKSLQPRLGSSPSNRAMPNKKQSIQPNKGDRQRQRSRSRDKIKSDARVPVKDEKPIRLSEGQVISRTEERDIGLIMVRPQFDKIVFRPLEITDPVFDKYLDMINNDNDAHYVMNALPELNSSKKADDSEGRDFVSGRISRLSGIFENLSVDKIITPIKRVPQYYSGPCGKNLIFLRVMLQTKFKVEVDLGFLQYSLDGDKLTVFRIYVSKIYRKMNYVSFVYLQALRTLISKHPGADRWSIFILEKNVPVHKFFKYLGFHIDKIATESNNKSVDYFQEFSMKRKQLSTVLSNVK